MNQEEMKNTPGMNAMGATLRNAAIKVLLEMGGIPRDPLTMTVLLAHVCLMAAELGVSEEFIQESLAIGVKTAKEHMASAPEGGILAQGPAGVQ